MRRILCYGDSNTYGANPKGGRFGETERWPKVMESRLGESYRVVEEGFGGRTTVFDDPVEGGYKSGLAYLPPCLMSHNPLSLVILMLGTNDLKARFSMSPCAVAYAQLSLIRACREYAGDDKGPAKVLLVAPPAIGENLMSTVLAGHFGEAAIENSQKLAPEYLHIARVARCEFFDAKTVCAPSERDAVHLTAEGHLRLAEALAQKVLEIFKTEA